MVVSPQHGILASLQEGSPDVFVRAIQLARLPGGKVRVAQGIRQLTYVHLLLPRHEIIYANGVATESFYPGPQSIQTLAPSAPPLAVLKYLFLKDIFGILVFRSHTCSHI
ncbi:Hint domain-containing protein [Litoreibacter ascidiaceicola]|uniref:Hint domain-containing protein n=1 Tax=Litoreibacter ascidiaceicola TaxID=1486859 RepID=UPI003CCBE7C4